MLISCKLSAQIIFNGDFKNIDPKTNLPVGWGKKRSVTFDYDYKLDSTVVYHGKYSLSIQSLSGASTFGTLMCILPYTFKGRNLVLKGFIKTENVVGKAGLWIRVDGYEGVIGFDNMNAQNIHGTTDWKEYTAIVPYDGIFAYNINVGGLLSGTGKMWMENIRLYLDGKLIEQVPARKPEKPGALKDTAFSKTSGIDVITANRQQVKNLALLGQVWGFVKYHHPAVAKGDFKMDAELFRVMPAIFDAQNTEDASNAIEKWVDKFGVPELCLTCKPYIGEITQKPDYGEIFDRSVVSASLADKLTYILNNRNQTGNNYYIGKASSGNPSFKHELSDTKMTYPDAGFRLLVLFRYWNMIQYFYPYKKLIGQDWDKVLAEFIPQFISAKNATEYGSCRYEANQQYS